VRAGDGVYDRALNGIWEQNALADPPVVQATTINNNASSTLICSPIRLAEPVCDLDMRSIKPSGLVQRFTDLPLGRYVTIREGQFNWE
jgi:hypothetical protein